MSSIKREIKRERTACGSILLLSVVALAGSLLHARQGAPAGQAGTQAAPPAGKTMTPVERADATPKGQLKNPYSDSDAAIVASGKQLYFGTACSGCHGGAGGGGMCPPLTDGVWIYGGDDDTLFRLVAYGSQALQEKGYTRKGLENIVAPMPAMGQVVKTDDDLWRILAFVRSNYHGPPECKLGCKGS
jgi:mono/diheme cytochrome c family protein